MTKQEKKDAILKWLSLSQYPNSYQNIEFIHDHLKKKYSELNYAAWKADLEDLISEMLSGPMPYIEKGQHKIYAPVKVGTVIVPTPIQGTHYRATLDGDAYVRDLPDLNDEMHRDYVVEFINSVLKFMPLYGPFEEETFLALQIHKSADLVKMAVEYDDTLLAKAFVFMQDYGYMIYRSDIQFNNKNNTRKLYQELTLKGRRLKEMGSIQAYKKWEKQEYDKVKRTEKENEIIRLASINNAEWQLKLNPLIEKSNDSTITTNTNIKETNIVLKKVFRWTLGVAIAGLLLSGINTLREIHKDTLSSQLQKADSIQQVSNSEILKLKGFENQYHKIVDSLKIALDSALHKP